MRNRERWSAYLSLWVFALAFGVVEASVVIYLREAYMRELTLQGMRGLEDLQVTTLVSLPARIVGLETAREACTLFLLGAVAWLAGRRIADRTGAFLLTFGIWDLTYYAILKLVSGWPRSLSTWDVLFLIPLPWVAPVWAPASVAALFVAAGSYLLWTPEHRRTYRGADVGLLVVAALMTLAAFMTESQAAIDHAAPRHFPRWLFWAGVALGAGWFLRVEQRTVAANPMEKTDEF